MGESRGAELALLIGSLRPDVAGVIAYSPLALRWAAVGGGDAAWTMNGVPLPYVEGVYNRATPMSQFTDVLDGPAGVRKAAAIEVESASASRVRSSSSKAETVGLASAWMYAAYNARGAST